MFRSGLALVALLVGSICSAQAASFSFTGSFTRDDDVQLFNFLVGSPSTVTLRTYSYAGGTNADGVIIPRGGFDPILALFDSTGALIDDNDDGSSSEVPADPLTGRHFDTYLEANLAAGSYTVAVSQYDNFAIGPNLSNGFERTGQPNFTDTLSGGCTQNIFCDVSNVHPFDNRNSNWAFDVLNVQSAVVVPPDAVPLPAGLPLFASALAGFFGIRLFRGRKQEPAIT